MPGTMRDYTVLKKLGAGSFGTVMLVEKGGERYCVKKVDVRRMSRKEKDAAMLESKLLKRFDHANIVQHVEQFIEGGTLCIVMELAEDGDLHERLKRQRGKLLSENAILDWFVQICLAMQHVHTQHVLHRDLKTQNIFLSGKTIKVGDFGVSRVLANTNAMAHTKIGTPYYLPPEICLGKRYDNKADIWSMGVVLYELTTLRHPFTGNSIGELTRKIARGKFAPPPSHFSADLRQLINDMLTLDPTKRPNVNDILGRSCCWRRAELLKERQAPGGTGSPKQAPATPPQPQPEAPEYMQARARAQAEKPEGQVLPHAAGSPKAPSPPLSDYAMAPRRPSSSPEPGARAQARHPAYNAPARRVVSAPVAPVQRRADGCVGEMRRKQQEQQPKKNSAQRKPIVVPSSKFVVAPRRDQVQQQKASSPFLKEQEGLLQKRGREQQKRREQMRAQMRARPGMGRPRQ